MSLTRNQSKTRAKSKRAGFAPFTDKCVGGSPRVSWDPLAKVILVGDEVTEMLGLSSVLLVNWKQMLNDAQREPNTPMSWEAFRTVAHSFLADDVSDTQLDALSRLTPAIDRQGIKGEHLPKLESDLVDARQRLLWACFSSPTARTRVMDELSELISQREEKSGGQHDKKTAALQELRAHLSKTAGDRPDAVEGDLLAYERLATPPLLERILQSAPSSPDYRSESDTFGAAVRTICAAHDAQVLGMALATSQRRQVPLSVLFPEARRGLLQGARAWRPVYSFFGYSRWWAGQGIARAVLSTQKRG